jgi:hypothetical protein
MCELEYFSCFQYFLGTLIIFLGLRPPAFWWIVAVVVVVVVDVVVVVIFAAGGVVFSTSNWFSNTKWSVLKPHVQQT